MAGNISVQVLCDQRRKQQQFNNPQFRYTPLNPYNGAFTKYQLDMRRKAEVLKYNNNNSSSKTNNLTKAEKFSQLIKGYGPIKTPSFQNKIITVLDSIGIYTTVTVIYPDKLVISRALSTDVGAVQIVGYEGYFTYAIVPNGLIVNCEADNLIPTPSSSCGVPGPIVNLIDDETVPLYNFTNASINGASYSNSQITSTNLWKVLIEKNVLLSTNVESYIGSMLISQLIDQITYTYTLEVPIGIYAKNISMQNGSATIFISGINLNVKYSGSIVPESSAVTSLSNYSYNMPINVNYTELTTSMNGYNYFAYVDTVVISGIVLATSPGYVYDFNLTVNVDTANSSSTYGFTDNFMVANSKNSTSENIMKLFTVPILPPSKLIIRKITNTTIDLSFIAPFITTNPLLNYTASANDGLTNQIGVGVASSSSDTIRITGLTSNTIYKYINVTANYKTGSSTSTAVISGTTIDFNPTNYKLVGTNTTATSLTVNFINGSNPQIFSYYIIAIPDTNSNNNQVSVNTFVPGTVVSSGPITIPGLISGTKYSLRLAQYLSNGRFGPVTNDISGTTLSPSPTSIIITDVSYTYIDLSFNYPSGSTPLGYIITTTPMNGRTITTDLSTISTPTFPIKIQGLNSGTRYISYITTIYNSVISSFNPVSSTVAATTFYSAPFNLGATIITDTSFALYYTVPYGTSPVGYTVSVTPFINNISQTPTIYNITGLLANPSAVTDLTPGTTYLISITAKYPVGNATSSILTVTTFGRKGSGIVIKNATVTSFDVSFNLPGGTSPSGYFITAIPSTTDNSQITVIYPTAPALSQSDLITVPGLISGSTYTVTVTSVYSTGNQISDAVNGNTLANAPTNLQVVNKTYSTISISFTAPIGTHPIGYNVSAIPSTSNGLAVSLFDISANPIVITGLSSGTLYTITLSSIYDIDTYDSIPITETTNSSPAIISGINTNSLTDPSTNSITVYISPPQAGSLPNSYSLIANPHTKLNNQTTITKSPIIPSSTTQPIIISGLISGTIYDVSLVTVFDIGSQTSVTTISGTTLAYPPTITSVINPTENSLTVNFIAPSSGSSPISYTAVATPESYNNSQQIITVSGLSKTSTNYVFTRLTSATTYDISMIAVYDTGNKISTDTFKGTTTSNPPTNIIVTDTTASTISISYDPPLGSAPISYYAILKPKTTTVGQISVTSARTTANQLTVTGLYSGTIYDISMVAVYSAANQMSTISVSGTTLSNPPTITTLNKKVTDASTNALTVYFTAPIGTLPSSYVATAVPNYTNNYQLIVNVTGINNRVTYFVIEGLVSGTTYDVSMSAVYASGYSGSNIITGTTLYNSATP